MKEEGNSKSNIYFHLLIESVVHNQAMSHSDPVRLHWMTGNVSIIADIRVIKVGDFLVAIGSTIEINRIERND